MVFSGHFWVFVKNRHLQKTYILLVFQRFFGFAIYNSGPGSEGSTPSPAAKIQDYHGWPLCGRLKCKQGGFHPAIFQDELFLPGQKKKGFCLL